MSVHKWKNREQRYICSRQFELGKSSRSVQHCLQKIVGKSARSHGSHLALRKTKLALCMMAIVRWLAIFLRNSVIQPAIQHLKGLCSYRTAGVLLTILSKNNALVVALKGDRDTVSAWTRVGMTGYLMIFFCNCVYCMGNLLYWCIVKADKQKGIKTVL